MEGLDLKRSFIVFLICLYTFGGAMSAYAEESKLELADQATSAILMERDTGQVLYEKNSDEQLPPQV